MVEEGPKDKDDPHPWTHLLVESSNLDELKGPLRGSARLKFTCLSVSVRYIALGSNTGNVYIFDRNTLKHLQVVFPEVEPAPVNVVALCPNDKLVAFSTIGHVIVMEMNIDKRQKPDRLRNITEHLRTTVTCLHWENSGARLYTADITGKVAVASIPRMKNLGLPVDVIMKLESAVVQLDWSDDKLLVSTMTRCYLCSTTRQQYSQVGKKPREGEYGGCFYKLNKTALPLMYCARPSSRVWEVDFEGSVLSTHQFKQLLAVPPIQVLNLRDGLYPTQEQDQVFGPQGTSFPQLKMLGSQYLVSVNKRKLFIFNPVKVKVILWSELPKDIQEVHVINSDIFLFCCDGEVRKLQLFPVAQVISILIKRKNLCLAADVCSKFENVLINSKWKKHLSMTLLHEFSAKLLDQNEAMLAEKVQQVMQNLQRGPEGESEGESSESYRSRSSSTTSIRSYTSCSGGQQDAVVAIGYTEFNSNLFESPGVTQTNMSISAQNQILEQKNGNGVMQDGTNTDETDGQTEVTSLDISGILSDTTSLCKANNILLQTNSRETTEEDHIILHSAVNEVSNDTVKEMNGTLNKAEYGTLDNNSINSESSMIDIQQGEEQSNGENRTHIIQMDEDLKPVIAEDSSREVDGYVSISRGKQKKKVTTVDLVNSSEKKKKGGRKTEKVVRSMSTGSLPSPHVKGSEIHVNSAIYEDDIFATDSIPLDKDKNKQKKRRNKSLSSQHKSPSRSSEIINEIDISVKSSTESKKQTARTLSLDQVLSNGNASSDHSALTNQHGDQITYQSFSTTEIAGVINNKFKSTSQGTVNAFKEKSDQSTPISTGSLKTSSSVTDVQTVTKPAVIRSALPQVRSESDMRRGSISDLEQEVLDSGSFESSPNYSPLSQSWEASGSDGGDMGMGQSPNKISLTSVKDSLQSKFILTKKRLLKTIKEKNVLSRSPLTDEMSPLSQSPLSRLTTVLGNENRTAADPLLENPKEMERVPPVDLADLELYTETTHKSLHNLNIVLDPDAIRTLLTKWVFQLNQSLQLLHTQMYQDKVEEKSRDKTCELSKKDGKSDDVTFYLNEQKLSDKLDTISQCSDADEEILGYDPEKILPDCSNSGADDISNSKSDNGTAALKGKSSNLLDPVMANMSVSFDGCDMIHAVDPFLMSPELHQSVSELAQVCFMSQVYGEVTKFAQPVQVLNNHEIIPNSSACDNISSTTSKDSDKQLINNVTSDSSLEFFRNDTHLNADISTIRSSNQIGNSFEGNDGVLALGNNDIDSKGYQTEQQKRQSMSSACAFMRSHCHLLDMQKVREEVYICSGDMFEYWCTYVSCIQELSKNDVFMQKLSNNEIHYAEDILKIGDYSSYRTLGYVVKLFEVSPTKAIEFSMESRHVQPMDVYFMCLYHNKSVTEHFYQFMFTRVTEALSTNRFEFITGVYGHSFVHLKWMEILLSGTTHEKPLSDADGHPLPWSHKVDWKCPEMIDHVLDSSGSDLWVQLLELCTVSRYWLGCLRMLKLLGQSHDMLTMILQLGDVGLLNSALPYGYLPTSIDEWTFFITNLVCLHKVKLSTSLASSEDTNKEQISQGANISCENKDSMTTCIDQSTKQECSCDVEGTITLTDMCKLMLRQLGAATTVTLLEDCGTPVIPPSVFQSTVVTCFLERHERNVAHNLLEKLDAYLWAKKPVTMMPELQYTVSHEQLTKSRHGKSLDHGNLLRFTPTASLPCVRYREELDIHWGVSAKINRSCICCNLPVTETVSHVEPGVFVFDCGHAYHKMCNPERQCVMCVSTNLDPPQFV